MTRADWVRVLNQAAAMRVEMVQFIGGEPTIHPDLPGLIEYALACELEVEVFTNLVHVTETLWAVFVQPGVSLATSYYSDDADQHAAITGRPSHARTKANITEALRHGIPLRAGVIDFGMVDGAAQRADRAQAELVDLGVPAVGYDRVRQVGRGVRDQQPSTAQLCGRCGDGVAAISRTGMSGPACSADGCPSATSWTSNLPRFCRAPWPTRSEQAAMNGLPRCSRSRPGRAPSPDHQLCQLSDNCMAVSAAGRVQWGDTRGAAGDLVGGGGAR